MNLTRTYYLDSAEAQQIMAKHGDNKWWNSTDTFEAAYYQLQEDYLIMDYYYFTEGLCKMFGRGFSPSYLKDECYVKELRQKSTKVWETYQNRKQERKGLKSDVQCKVFYDDLKDEREKCIGIIEDKSQKKFHMNYRIFDEIIQQSFEGKVNLKEKLGLGDDYRRTIEITDNTFIKRNAYYLKIKYVIRNILGFTYQDKSIIGFIMANRIKIEKREMKFGKWLLNEISKQKKQTEVDNYLAKDYWNKVTLQDCLSLLMEQTSSLNSQIVITANPLDMFLASECCSYDSCYNIGGAYNSGCLAYIRDNTTFMVFVKSKSKNIEAEKINNYPFWKDGRSWCHLVNNDVLAMGRKFGNITQSQIKSVADILTKEISGEKWYSKTSKLPLPNKYLDGQRSIYRDKFSKVCATGSYFSAMEVPPKLETKAARCLCCGELVGQTNYFFCPNCYSKSVDVVLGLPRTEIEQPSLIQNNGILRQQRSPALYADWFTITPTPIILPRLNVDDIQF